MEQSASTSQSRQRQQSAAMHAISGLAQKPKRAIQTGLASLLLLAFCYQACQMFFN